MPQEGPKQLTLLTTCPICKRTKLITVPAAGYYAWKGGALIQNALPLLSSDERESLITGTCATCWDEMWKETAE